MTSKFNNVLFASSVFSAAGWIILAWTFYITFFAGGMSMLHLNLFGEMYIEAYLLVPAGLAVAILNPIMAFNICKRGYNS